MCGPRGPDDVRQDPAGLREADMGALPDGEVAKGLGDVSPPDADRAEEDDRLACMEPTQSSQVPDLGCGQFRVQGFQMEDNSLSLPRSLGAATQPPATR